MYCLARWNAFAEDSNDDEKNEKTVIEAIIDNSNKEMLM
jgi:hypothetical protein